MISLKDFITEVYASVSKDPILHAAGVTPNKGPAVRYKYIIKSPDDIKNHINGYFISKENDIGPENWKNGITEKEFTYLSDGQNKVNCRFVAVNLSGGNHAIIISPASGMYHAPLLKILSEAFPSFKLKRSGKSVGEVPDTYVEFLKNSSQSAGKDYFKNAAESLDILLGFVNVQKSGEKISCSIDITEAAEENKGFVNSNKNYLKNFLGQMSKKADETEAPPSKISFSKKGKTSTVAKLLQNDWGWLESLISNFSSDLNQIASEI